MANPTGIVSEYVVRIDGHPKFSGSKMGANVALQNALMSHMKEGRGEPVVQVTLRTVNYDLNPNDPNVVSEVDVQL